MKKLRILIIFLALGMITPIPAMARVNVDVSIGLPPIIIGGPPPVMVEVPDTDQVYVAPEVSIELFFWNGWWWHPYEGHWYRSHYYNHGWGYYNSVPMFYHHVDPGWRGYYRTHNWHGRQWNYQHIPGGHFQGQGHYQGQGQQGHYQGHGQQGHYQGQGQQGHSGH